MTPDNPLRHWRVQRNDIHTVGQDLRRPECILAEPDGSLWSADARGGVCHLGASGEQRLVVQQPNTHFDASAGDDHARFMQGTLPNGLAFDGEGNFLIANFGTDALERMDRSGRSTVLLDRIDGLPIGKVNFVLRDSRNRIWLTVSTRCNPWVAAMRPGLADGYIVLIDQGCPRIVADGFAFTNEIRLDAREEWLYIAETTGKRISRMRVGPDGSLSAREIHGPASLGAGFPDGIAFDAYGNLWVAMIMSERLLAITPQGDVLTLLDDGNPAAIAELEHHFAQSTLTTEIMARARGSIAPWLASITFGGADLSTVYLGSLMGSSIACFRSPVAGLPMAHWQPVQQAAPVLSSPLS
ncbi:SMP-30/gluconolactonase/LRE family protein [Herbaspirillum sp. NPDC087042]|uniref:SMP-30/gluconolactonase/LRE family protein n=1 Tax=Herbaspirillum sp. NPDC087042 TaxID=3364004 RepID=UPI00381193D0